jgi:hypothetical protein
MSRGAKTEIPRKAMRVATVFTGVAACTTVFAPAANAQAIAPAIRKASNGCAGVPTWFHLYPEFNANAVCYGYSGSAGNRGNVAEILLYSSLVGGFCGGNNSGYFSGTSVSGRKHYPNQAFFQGSKPYLFKGPKFPKSEIYMSFLYIFGWMGKDKCPAEW